jgi:hypothetical protein
MLERDLHRRDDAMSSNANPTYAQEMKSSITTIALVASVWVVTGAALLLTAVSTRAHGRRVDATPHGEN